MLLGGILSRHMLHHLFRLWRKSLQSPLPYLVPGSFRGEYGFCQYFSTSHDYQSNISSKLGVGSEIDSWQSIWLGSQPLKIQIMALFDLFQHQRLTACDAVLGHPLVGLGTLVLILILSLRTRIQNSKSFSHS